jgi:hypothetical protein
MTGMGNPPTLQCINLGMFEIVVMVAVQSVFYLEIH